MWESYKHAAGHIDIGAGALRRAAHWIRRHERPLVVCDANTREAAGASLCAALDAQAVKHDLLTYPDQSLTADENAIGRLCAAYTPPNGVIVGVGAGTINDLCKFVAFRAGRPCVAVGTAPSMDGYASAGAAMTLGGMKVTPRAQCPEAIFCDLDILCGAPMPMLAAGLGDVLGKITALADWRLSHLLTGEPMPDDIVQLVSDAVFRCQENAPGLAQRRPEAVRSVTEALILSGIAMSLYGDSRPASGSEHHISHYWEMCFISEKKPPVLHGLKVGVATLVTLGLWRRLRDNEILSDNTTLSDNPVLSNEAGRRARTEAAIRRAYGAAADGLLQTPNPNLPYGHIRQHRDGIREIAASLPDAGEVAGLLALLGAPLTPDGIGVDAGMLADSVWLARERKKTYTLLQLLGDLGLLENAAENFRRAKA